MHRFLDNPGVTLGCVTLGTIIVLLTFLRWWKKGSSGGGGKGGEGSGRKWGQLVPFVIALAYGMLIVLSASSVSALGFLVRAGLWGGNGLGHVYLVWGIGGNDQPMSSATPALLTIGGKATLAIWTALQLGAQMWSKKQARLYSTLGVCAGVCLGLSAGIAGVAASPLASFANGAGAWYYGIVS